MLVAAHTGTSPTVIREEWSWRDVEAFVECLPGIRAYGHPMFSMQEDT
jgi:hypothetical protein